MALLGVSILMGLAGVDRLSFLGVVANAGAVAGSWNRCFTIAKVIHRGAEPIGTVHLRELLPVPRGRFRARG